MNFHITFQGGYNTAPMPSTGTLNDQQAHQAYMGYYPGAAMSYPFMNQPAAPTLSDGGTWSNGATADPSMNFLGSYNQMGGTDYMPNANPVFSGFGYQPGFGWELPGASDYSAWANTGPPTTNTSAGPPRKDDRMVSQQYQYYLTPTEDPNVNSSVSYNNSSNAGILNGTDMEIKSVDHALKDMTISGPNSGVLDHCLEGVLDRSSLTERPASSEKPTAVVKEDATISIPHSTSHQSQNNHQATRQVTTTQQQQPQSNAAPVKKSWASIAKAPAKQQISLRPKSIPRAPVLPGNKQHNVAQHGALDIGTWDNSAKREPPTSASTTASAKSIAGQPLPTRQAWSTGVVRSGTSWNNTPSYSPTNVGGAANGEQQQEGDNRQQPRQAHNNSTQQSQHSGQHDRQQREQYNNRNVSQRSTEDIVTPTVSTEANPILDRLRTANQYNPRDLTSISAKNARFFIIKSYSEDDIHRSIKYSIWCSTEHGNKRLDAAYREREGKGPVYLFFSVNGSGHFCGMTQMMSPLDYSASSGVWAQDKWKGQFEVKWIFVKDVPNSQLRHIRLENNENKPVTNSRDTQEALPEKGKQVLKIMCTFRNTTSIFDDFSHYEKRQEEDTQERHDNKNDHRGGHHRNDHRGEHRNDHRGEHRNDHRGGEHRNDHRGGEHRNDHRGGDHRNDHRNEHRNDYRNDHRGEHHRGGHNFDRNEQNHRNSDHMEGGGRKVKVDVLK